MTDTERRDALGRLLAELSLPLASDASILDALEVAVAVEDGCAVVLPEAMISVTVLQDRESIEAAVLSLSSEP